MTKVWATVMVLVCASVIALVWVSLSQYDTSVRRDVLALAKPVTADPRAAAGASEDVVGASTRKGTPGAPEAPTVSRSNSAIRVKWLPPASPGGEQVKYQVRLNSAGADPGKWRNVGRKRHVTLTGDPAQRYRIRIRAVNSHGASRSVSVVALRSASIDPDDTAALSDFEFPDLQLSVFD